MPLLQLGVMNGFKDVDSRFLGNDRLKKERKKMRS